MPDIDLPTLVSWVRADKVRIPAFQREFVWSENDIALLAESIYKEYPIGILTFYEIEPGIYYVLDGQQRIFSICMMFGHDINVNGGSIGINVWVNPLIDPPAFKASKRKLYHPWIRLDELINARSEDLPRLADRITKSVLPGAHEVGKILGTLNKIWLAFRDYKVLYYVVPQGIDIDDLGEIYDRINFAGKKVAYADIVYSIVAIANESLAVDLRNFHRQLRGMQWDLDLSVLVRAFLAVISDGRVKFGNKVLEQAARIKEILKNMGGQLRPRFEAFKNSIRESIDLLSADDTLAIRSTDTKLLLSQAPLVVIAFSIYRLGGANRLQTEDKSLLLKWFALSQYHRRYSSAAETRLNEDLEALKSAGVKGLVRKLKEFAGAGILPDESELESYGSDKLLLLYSLLKFNDATDLLEVNERLNSYFTVHHIFPKALVGRELAEDIANITFVKETTNRRLRDRRPSEYLSNIPRQVLEKHYIPLDARLWQDYEAFIEARRKLIAQGVKKVYSEFPSHYF